MCMFDLFTGNREKAREALDSELKKEMQKGTRIVRITDAHSLADLDASLQGGGLFNEKKIVIFDGIVGGGSEELAIKLLAQLPAISQMKERFYVLEGVLDASTRKMLEKHAEDSKRFDAEKKGERTTIFALGNALRSSDKKALWIGYHRELQKGAAPEAIHGVLFWAAKELYLSAKNASARERGAFLIAQLAELPHEARRRGFDLEYALENFALSGT